MAGSVHRKPGTRDVWRVVIDVGTDPATGKRKRMVQQVRGSKREAQARLATLTHDMTAGQYVSPSKATLGAFLERWLDYMQDRLAPSALASYRAIVRNRLIPALGSVPLQQLQTAHVVAVEKRWLESGRARPSTRGPRATPGLSAKTVVNYHRALVEALNHAVRWELVRSNVADAQHMDPPRAERAEVTPLDLAQVRRLLAVLPDERHGVAIHTLIATGLRVGEVLGLRWRDVDLDSGSLRIQQQYDRVLKRFRDVKSHRSRRPIAIDADLVALLRRHHARQNALKLQAGAAWEGTSASRPCPPDCHGRVFTDDAGHHLKHDNLRHALVHAMNAAGLDYLNLHGLRHTHASLLIQLGAHMKLVQERLGHASFAITADTYSHLNADAQRVAARQFGAALRPQQADLHNLGNQKE